MNEKKALNLVENFPDWVAESAPKGDEANKGIFIWGAIKAQILVSKIQWFIHVLYLRGYEIRKIERGIK